MEEDMPAGWDKCADWDLRIRRFALPNSSVFSGFHLCSLLVCEWCIVKQCGQCTFACMMRARETGNVRLCSAHGVHVLMGKQPMRVSRVTSCWRRTQQIVVERST